MTASGTDTPARKGFAKRLRALMGERELSHRQLASAVGASKQSVTNWTQGHNDPSLRHLRKLAHVLEVPLASLLAEEDEEPLEEEESPAAELLREFASQPIAPAVQALGTSAPDLLDLLSRAERYVRDLDAG